MSSAAGLHGARFSGDKGAKGPFSVARPMALFTFFESHNLSGKKLIPFCSHEGSSLGRSVVDMQKLAPGATILEGLAIRGRSVDGRTTRTDIADWLAKLHVPMAQEQ